MSTGEMKGPWGERMYADGVKGGWNNISGGWLVRHPTKRAAEAACRESNREGCRFQVKPEKIPPGKRREACDMERQIMSIRHFVAKGWTPSAIIAIDDMLRRYGWGQWL